KYDVTKISASFKARLGRTISIMANRKTTTREAKIISAVTSTLLSALSDRITKKITKQLTDTKGIMSIIATQNFNAQIKATRQLKSTRSGVGSRSSLTCVKSERQKLVTLLLIVNHYVGRSPRTK